MHCTHWPWFGPDVAHTARSPVQSVALIAPHARQVLSAVLQMGRDGSRQSVLAVHPTHVLVVVLHTVGAAHAAVIPVAHSTQRPAFAPSVAHTGRAPAQSLATQARHARVVTSHTGVAPAQSVSVRHATQRLAAVLQSGVAPVHAPARAAVHSTQRPALSPAVAHAGVAPVQSVALVTSHARQVLVVVLQIGREGSRQSAWVVHPTHALVAGLQTEGAMQAPVWASVHSTQRPALAPAVAHTGVAPVQSAATQARQRRDVRSQSGVAPAQSPWVLHPTHTFGAARSVVQSCVAPAHDPRMPPGSGVQATQLPALTPAPAHTGSAAEGQSAACVAVLHARQTLAVGSHTGNPGV